MGGIDLEPQSSVTLEDIALQFFLVYATGRDSENDIYDFSSFRFVGGSQMIAKNGCKRMGSRFPGANAVEMGLTRIPQTKQKLG